MTADSRSPDAAVAIRRAIAARAAGSSAARPLKDATPLMDGGLGLDSVAVVELLLHLERRLGIPFSSELLDEEPLTVGRIVAHARRVRAAGDANAG